MEEPEKPTLEDAILREKKLVAECHLIEAWQAGLEDGIEPEILARALLVSTLDQFARLEGLAAADRMAGDIGAMAESSSYLSGKSLQ